MAETHDTIKGLLAEFRGYSAGMPASYHVTMSWADFRKMLDRLEKANKRERGNSAALRNALNLCVDEMCARCRDLAKARGNPAPCLNGCEPVRKAKAALAEPVRNCDRFGGDIDKLREACARERGLNPEEDFPDVFPGWLLAPSTEREGGNDGR